jgi:hypothetical protein
VAAGDQVKGNDVGGTCDDTIGRDEGGDEGGDAREVAVADDDAGGAGDDEVAREVEVVDDGCVEVVGDDEGETCDDEVARGGRDECEEGGGGGEREEVVGDGVGATCDDVEGNGDEGEDRTELADDDE